eukprot:SAG25_NODE_4142_length_881_cov_0.973146_1_plen_37_part_10
MGHGALTAVGEELLPREVADPLLELLHVLELVAQLPH